MAKIQRFSGNVRAFAIDAQANERTVFGGGSESDSLDSNLNSDFFRGWGISADSKPTYQDFNALGFTNGQLLAYLVQSGIAEWSENQEYHTGGIGTRSGTPYISTSNDNEGNDPETDFANWEPVGFKR